VKQVAFVISTEREVVWGRVGKIYLHVASTVISGRQKRIDGTQLLGLAAPADKI